MIWAIIVAFLSVLFFLGISTLIIIGNAIHDNQIKLVIKDGKIFVNPHES